MRHKSRIILTAVCLTAIIVLWSLLSHRGVAGWAADTSGRILTPIAQRIGYGQALISVLIGRGDIVRENIELKKELERAHAAVAQADELIRDNRFLRDSLGLREKIGRQLIDASIFSYPQAGGVRHVVINKGRSSGISLGDVVITDTGVLIGLVSDAREDHSLVRVVGDPLLEITVRVVGTEIVGLMRATAENGLVLDLVKKDEPVSEGQSVATSGNDSLPAGILIGTVRSVDTESTTLFKTVRLTSDALNHSSGRVMVFHP